MWADIALQLVTLPHTQIHIHTHATSPPTHYTHTHNHTNKLPHTHTHDQPHTTLTRTYQLNTGGNTDFLNMLNQQRLASKKQSKTEAVQSAAAERLADENIHVGPSDYVPWQKDNKVCFLRMEGLLFGDVPMNLELRLSVEDSPNSAGVAIDAIRCCKLAMRRGQSGALHAACAALMKHPPRQLSEDEAHRQLEAFVSG